MACSGTVLAYGTRRFIAKFITADIDPCYEPDESNPHPQSIFF
jgi:hypothetical protein